MHFFWYYNTGQGTIPLACTIIIGLSMLRARGQSPGSLLQNIRNRVRTL